MRGPLGSLIRASLARTELKALPLSPFTKPCDLQMMHAACQSATGPDEKCGHSANPLSVKRLSADSRGCVRPCRGGRFELCAIRTDSTLSVRIMGQDHFGHESGAEV